MSGINRCEILENREIARKIFRLRVSRPKGESRPEPGQFVNVYLNDESRLLPRPLSVCDWEPGCLTLVYAVAGQGTEQLSTYARGTPLRVSAPLGNGFRLRGVDRAVLVGGGLGVAPLLYLGKTLVNRMPLRTVLGFRSEPFLVKNFPGIVEVATNDGSAGFHGTVTDLLSETGAAPGAGLFACGPRPMLRALAGFSQKRGLSLQVSLEERMACGYGACLGCVCKTKSGRRKVCEDGPVFDGGEVVWDA